MVPQKARRNTGDFKSVISYGYASHRAEDITDKITNAGKSPMRSHREDRSVVDLTGIDDMEMYVDRSIREGYTGRAVPKRYHEFKDGQKKVELAKVRPQNYISERPTFTNPSSPKRFEGQYKTVTNHATPERLR